MKAYRKPGYLKCTVHKNGKVNVAGPVGVMKDLGGPEKMRMKLIPFIVMVNKSRCEEKGR